MFKIKTVLALLLILAGVVSAAACTSGSSTPTPTTTPTPTGTATLSPVSPTATEPTYGQLAIAGAAVYSSHCASCHGNNGQGTSAPALWGSSAHLSGFNTAQGLLDYISTTMPPNAPGSLTHQDYLNTLSYLLVQDNDVSGDSVFNESQLPSISLQ